MQLDSESTDIVYVAGGVLHARPRACPSVVIDPQNDIRPSLPPETRQSKESWYATVFKISRVAHPEVNVRVGKCQSVM